MTVPTFVTGPDTDDIVNIKEVGLDTTGVWDLSREKKYTRTFIAVTKHKSIPPSVILADDRIPALRTPYSVTYTGNLSGGGTGSQVINDSDSVVMTRECRRRDADNPNVWDITVQYGFAPLAEPTEVTIDFETFQVPATVDLAGNDIVNSAGDTFDPPPMIDDSQQRIVIKWNRTYSGITEFLAFTGTFKDKVNDGEFLGQLDGSLKCSNIGGTRRIYGTKHYWEVTAEFRLAREQLVNNIEVQDWELHLAQQGFNVLRDDGGGNKKKDKARAVGDASGYSGPVFLNNDGTQKSVPISATNPVEYADFQVYDSIDFALMLIPGLTSVE